LSNIRVVTPKLCTHSRLKRFENHQSLTSRTALKPRRMIAALSPALSSFEGFVRRPAMRGAVVMGRHPKTFATGELPA